MAAVQTAFDFTALAPERGLSGGRSAGLSGRPSRIGAQDEAARSRHLLERQLGAMLGRAVSLTLTDNARTMVSSRVRSGVEHVRLHHMFVGADEPTVRALSRFLRGGDRIATRYLDDYVRNHSARIRTRERRPAKLAPRGKHHDLRRLMERLNERYFGQRLEASIGWARMSRPAGRRRSRRSIKLGSYRSGDASIRIHPVLDSAWVPEFFVEYVVYHEMLHHELGIAPAEEGGRRRMHTREFRERERGFARYQEAMTWERDHLHRLLSG